MLTILLHSCLVVDLVGGADRSMEEGRKMYSNIIRKTKVLVAWSDKISNPDDDCFSEGNLGKTLTGHSLRLSASAHSAANARGDRLRAIWISAGQEREGTAALIVVRSSSEYGD